MSLKLASVLVLVSAVSLTAQNPAPQIKQPATGTGVVMGKVVDAATGQPIAEAIVTLEPDPREQSENMQALRQLRDSGDFTSLGELMPRGNRVLSDNNGVFVFRDVRKGSLSLHAEATGYLSAMAGQERPLGPSRPIEIDEGGRVLDVVIKLKRGAVITGIVTDEQNEPVVRAMVRAFSVGSPMRYERASTTTDDRGIYRITSLEPGEYVVGIPQTEQTMPTAQMDAMLQAVSSMGADMRSFGDMFGSVAAGAGPAGLRLGEYMVSSSSGVTLPPGKDGRINIYDSAFYPAARRISDATPIRVESGEERTGVDLQLRLVPTSIVSGVVTGPSGPVRNAPVRLEPQSVDSSAFGFGTEVAATTTKVDGTFVMFGVPDGQYVAKVIVQPPPDLPDELKSNPMVQAMLSMSGGSKTPLFGRAEIVVNAGDVRGVTIAAGEGTSLTGRIEFEGRTAKPTPQSLQQMQIQLMPADESSNRPEEIGRPRVNADQTFKTGTYPPGRYWVEIFPGDSAWTPKSVMVDGHDLIRESIEFAGREMSDAVITFTDNPSQLTGVVRSDTGALPDHVVVIIVPQDYRGWIANGMPHAMLNVAAVNRDGSYAAGRLLRGEYLVAATVVASNPPTGDPRFIEALARVATRVLIGDGDRKTQDLKLVDVKR